MVAAVARHTLFAGSLLSSGSFVLVLLLMSIITLIGLTRMTHR
jgi:hypothetical protein